MGRKRKRLDSSEGKIEDGRRRQKQKQSQILSNDASVQKILSQPAQRSVSLAPLPRPRSTSAATNPDGVRAFFEPPSGLSKRQRKRWRKKHRQQVATHGTVSDPPLNPVRQHKQAVETLSIATKTKTSVVSSTIRHFAVTKLVQRPTKRWHNSTDTPNLGPNMGSSKISNSAPEIAVDNDKRTDAQPIYEMLLKAGVEQVDNRISNLKSPSTSSGSPRPSYLAREGSAEDDAGTGENDARSDEEPDALMPEISGIGQKRVHEKTTNALSSQPNSALLKTHSSDLRSSFKYELPNTTPGGVVFGRSSFGNRATTVPSYSNEQGAEAAFKRFTAFLNGDGSDSSDDESEESEEECGGDSLHELCLADATTTAAAEYDLDVQNKDQNHSQELTQHYPGPSNDVDHTGNTLGSEVEHFENHEAELPKFSNSASKPAATINFSWPANVGIKRNISFLGPEPGGTRSGSAPHF